MSDKEIIANNRFVCRDSGIIIPEDHEDERILYFVKNYDLIAHYIPMLYNTQPRLFVEECKLDKDYISRPFIDYEAVAVKIASNKDIQTEEGRILDSRKLQKYVQSKKRCRFCRKSEPETIFREKAHAISEHIENKTVFLRNECDECNGIFSAYEDSLAKYLGAMRTLSQIVGKKKIPAYLDNKNTISIQVGYNATVIQEISGAGHAIIQDNQFSLELEKQPYVPLNVFKALAVMALSIMPEDEFKVFKDTSNWLINKNDNHNCSNYASQVIIRFLPGPKPLKTQAWLFRRQSVLTGGMSVFDVPYCIFVIEFANYSFQIIVPNFEKDAMLLGKNVSVPMFISSFEFSKELQKYGKAQNDKHDFSSTEKVEHETMNVQLFFEGYKDITTDEEDVASMAKREGVKPIFETVDRKKSGK